MKSNYVEGNLGRASFLSVRGYRLAEMVPIGRKMVAFSFVDHDGKARETADTYSNGATAPAEALLDSFSDLKSLMYQRKSSLNEGHEGHEGKKQTHPHTRN